MAVFSYIGGSVSLATGSYGSIAVRKGSQVSVAATPTTSARTFIEATPAAGLLEPVNRVHQLNRITHTSGYSATKLNFNTTEPYNSGAYSTSQYYTPYNTIFNDIENYNTSTSTGGEYWAHAQGYINSELGTAIAVDKDRNAWVIGSTDYDSCTVTSITASLTASGFTNSTTAPSGGTNDSGYFYIGNGVLPFNHNIFGLNNSNIVVHTNSWIGFQPLVNTGLTSFSGTSPPWVNIQIGAGEASCQRVFHGSFGTAPNRTYRVRFEGTNATTGTIGSPNMVWEFIVYESNPNIFDIQIGAWTPPATNFNGISDGTTYFGTFTPTANTGWRFNTGTVTAGASGSNITLVKYSTKGKFQQNKDFFPYTGTDDLEVFSIGRDGFDVGESIKVGSDGRLYILYTSNSYPYTSGFGDNELGVIKLDSDYLYKTVNSTRTSTDIPSSVVWNKSFGTTNNDSGQSLDLDPNDNLYITGFSIGTGQGNNDVVVLKVDKNGSLIWKRTYGAVGGELGQAIKYSPDGNLYVWGISSSSPLINATADFYLLKINGTTGAIIWQKHFNISASTNATVFENTVDVDEYSNVYVCGFSSVSPIAYVVSKLDKDGNFKWTRSVGALTGSVDAGTAIKYKKGYLYVGGQDSSTFNNSESYGLGVSKLNADTGQLLSNYVIGGVDVEYAFGIDVDDYGDIYATGAVNTTMVGLGSASGTNAFTTKFILDTPQGGFTLSGAAACNRYLNTYKYTTSKEYFDANSIVFQNDLFATGQQSIFVGTTSQSQFNQPRRFSGSGSILSPQSSQTFQVTTRSSSYTASTELSARSGLYTIGNQISLRTGTVPLYSTFIESYSNLKFTFKPDAGSGTISISNQSSAKVRFKANDGTGLFSISGTAVVINITKQIYNYTSSGTISLSGTATERQTDRPAAGSGTIIISEQASAKVIFKPADGTGLFAFTNGYSNLKATSSYISDNIINIDGTADIRVPIKFSGSGTFTETGSANQATARVAFIPINTIILYNTNVITKLAMQYAGKSPTTPFGGLEIVFEELEANAPPQQFKYTGSASTPLTAKISSTGILQISGTGSYTANQASLVGSGSISLSGQHGVNVFKPNWITSGNIVVQSAAATNKQLTFSGSGSLPALISKLELLPITTTQYQHRTNVLSDITKYFRTNISSVTSATSIPNPVTGLTGDSAVYNVVTSSSGAVFPGYLDPRSSTGVFATNTTVFMSIFAKANTWGKFRLVAYSSVFGSSGALPNHEIQYDVSLGTATNLQGTNPPLDYGIVPYSNGWYRCWIKLNVRVASDQSGGSGWFQIKFSSDSSANNSMYWYGPQLQKDILTSFVENTTSAALTTTAYLDGGSDVDNSLTYADNDTLFFTTGGAAGIKAPNRHIGASPIAYYDPSEIVFGEGDNFYATEFKITSQSQYTKLNNPQSSGSLFVSNQASAAVLFRSADGTGLFTFTNGYSNLKATDAWLGSGTIDVNEQASARVTFKPAGGTGLFTFTNGYSNLNATSAWVGTGTTTFSGAAGIKAPNRHIGASPIAYYDPNEIVFGEGDNFYATELKITSYQSQYRVIQGPTQYTTSGSLFAIGGASEAVRFKPADGTGLFTISGQLGNNIFQPNWITSGTISISNQASAVVLFRPADGTGLFTFTNGYSNLKATDAWLGSGTINVGEQATAAVSFKPAGGTGLFTFSDGYSNLNATTKPAAGSGTITTSGAYSNFTAASAWSGSGSVTLSGTAVTKQINVSIASGTATFSGAATEKVANKHIGSSPFAYYDPNEIVFGEGDIFYATQFKITSQSQYTKSNKLQSSGSLFAGSQASAVVSFKPADGTGLFTFTNSAVLKQTNISIDGSGTIILSGAATLPLFAKYFGSGSVTLSGSLVESETNRPAAGSGTINASNQASATVLFKPVDGTGLFAFSGFVVDKHIDITSGSGTIITSKLASAKVTFKPADGTGLFTFSDGYSNLNATSILIGTGSATLSGTAGIKAPNRHIGASPIAYYDPSEIVFGEGDIFYATEFKITSFQSLYRLIQGPASYQSSGSLFIEGTASEAIRFKPADGTGLFSISGQLGDNVFKPNWITSGTINTSNQASAVVSFKAVDGTGLFTFTNSAVLKQTNISIDGSGTISSLSGGAEKVTFKALNGTGLFAFTDGYSNLNATTRPAAGSGTITLSGAYSNFAAAFAWSGSGPVTLSGAAVQKHIDIASGSGTITLSGDARLPLFAKYSGSGSVTLSGSLVESETNRTSGSGTINASNQASAAVSFKANDGTGLFTFTNGYSNLKATNISIDGSGSLFSSGFFSNLKVTFKSSGTGLFAFSGQHGDNVFKPNWITSGTISISNQASAAVSFKAVDGTGLFTFTNGYSNLKATNISIDGSGSLFSSGFFSNLKVTFKEVSVTGLFSVSGSVVERETNRPAAGSGTINIAQQASAAVSFKANDGTGLFTFTNGYSNLKATDAWVGSGTATLSGSVVEKQRQVALGSGSATLSGTVTESETNRPAAGSGTISISNQASAAISFRPVDGTGLFTFTNGYSNLKATDAWVGSGSVTIDSTSTAKVVWVPSAGTGLFAVTGTAGIKLRDWIFVSPIVEFDPYELIINDDFVVTDIIKLYQRWNATNNVEGSSGVSSTNIHQSSGSLFADSTASATVTFNPTEGDPFFVVSGSALDSHTEVAVVSGTATISGSVAQSQTNLPAAGSGTISISQQASAAVSFKAVDGTGLFSVSGSIVEKQTEVAVGSGTISISQQASAVVSFKALDGTGLFTFAGSLVEKQTDIASGSGTINASNQSSARVTFKPADGTGLFAFFGSVVETQTEVAIGSGTATISGNAIVPSLIKYSGSGTTTISGSAVENQTDITSGSGTIDVSNQSSARVTFKPTTDTYLFSVSGSATESQTDSAAGSGTITFSQQASASVTFNPPEDTYLFTLSGSLVEKQTEVAIGSGTINASNQASAKVTFKPTTDTYLFVFSGQLGNNIFKPNWITSGTISISNQSSAAVSFKAVDGTGLFTFSGSVVQSQINRTSGSGTINASNQASAKVTFKPAEGTGLFNISGQLGNNIFKPNWITSGTISISNQSSAAVSFKAVDGTGLFTFSGSVVQSQINRTSGSGTINASNQASAKVTFKPAEGTGLFGISGSLVEKQTEVATGSGTISISNQASAKVTFKAVDGTGLFTFFNAAVAKQINVLIGSGTINASNQASAKVTFKPAEGTGLFSVSGTVVERQTDRPAAGSGTISISNQSSAVVSVNTSDGTGLFAFANGYSNFKASSAWLGSGTINASNQASAAVSFKPAEGTGLFAISGNANIVVQSNYNGSGIQLFSYINNVIVYTSRKLPPFSGVTFVSGDSSSSTQYSNVGSGTINVSNEASAKVTFSASSSTTLFKISGEAIVKVPNYRGSGIINVGNQASANVSFKPAEGTGLFTFSDGYSNLKASSAWLGSGSLFSIGSSPESRTFIWKTEPREISYLLSGAAEYDHSTSYESTILLNISGSARVKTELPERIFATII